MRTVYRQCMVRIWSPVGNMYLTMDKDNILSNNKEDAVVFPTKGRARKAVKAFKKFAPPPAKLKIDKLDI